MKNQVYLLDSDIVISMLRNQYNVRNTIVEKGFGSCRVSEITIAELYYGAFHGNMPEKNEKEIAFVLNHFQTVPIGRSAKVYGQIRAALEKSGERLDSMDLLIAGTAIANGFTLVSHNIRHFSRIPDLMLEDWVNQ